MLVDWSLLLGPFSSTSGSMVPASEGSAGLRSWKRLRGFSALAPPSAHPPSALAAAGPPASSAPLSIPITTTRTTMRSSVALARARRGFVGTRRRPTANAPAGLVGAADHLAHVLR